MSGDEKSRSLLDSRKTELKVDEILAEFLSKKIDKTNKSDNSERKEKKHGHHKHKKSKTSHKGKKSKKSKKSKKDHRSKSRSNKKSSHRYHSSISRSSSSDRKYSSESNDESKNTKTEKWQYLKNNKTKDSSLICSNEYHSEDELIQKKLQKLQNHLTDSKIEVKAESASVHVIEETTKDVKVNEKSTYSSESSTSVLKENSKKNNSVSQRDERLDSTNNSEPKSLNSEKKSSDKKAKTASAPGKNDSSRDQPARKSTKYSKGSPRRSRSPSKRKSIPSSSRYRSRSRSPDYHRRRSRSSSRARKSRYDSHHHSYSLKRKYDKSSRSKSPSPKKKSSRDSRQSSEEKSNKIDKSRLLEIARKNAISMIQTGQIPTNTTAEKEEVVAIKAGGRSVAELTDFCKSLAQGSDHYSSENEKSGEDDKKSEDEEGPFINHPFKVSENRPNIIMNIRNAVQVPVKTPAEKATEQAKLRLQFPVSSGSQHRVKESEWVPVVKEKKPEVPKEKEAATAPPPALAPPSAVTLEQQINKSRNTPAKVPETQSQAAMDLSQIVSERLSALRKLEENPQDVIALNAMYKADKRMQSWVQSKQLPGQFTGSTDANLLSPDQLSGPYQAWVKKMLYSKRCIPLYVNIIRTCSRLITTD